jgi:uncharacterized protein YecT (DUF1311 family)
MSLMLAASALQWACVDDARTETATAHARDSSLTHDLELAGHDSADGRLGGRDTSAPSRVPPMVETGSARSARSAATGTRTVTESPGALATTEASYDPASTPASTRTSSAAPVPSAEGYIGPSCASPALDDQKRCLLGYLARSDMQLDRSYQALIARLKAEAGTRAGAAEPAAVQRLRTTQRAWLVYRDDECRKQTSDGEGPLWAPVRAKCLAEYSAQRERELDDALAQRKSTIALRPPAKPKVVKHTKRTKAKRRSRR